MSAYQQRPKGLLNTVRFTLCRILGCEQPAPPPPPPPVPQQKDRRSSFVPGQIMLLAEFDPQHTPTRQQLVRFAFERLEQNKVERFQNIVLTPERIIILPGLDRTRVTISGEVPALRRDPGGLIKFILAVHGQIKKEPLVGVPPKGATLERPRGKAANDQTQSADAQSNPVDPAGAAEAKPDQPVSADSIRFELRAASPNWLASSAKDIIGGGPGARPIEATSITTQAEGKQPWEFTFASGLAAAANGAVQVAILDSVPPPAQLLYAYHNWVRDEQGQPVPTPNQLLGSLLSAPNGTYGVLDQTTTPQNIGPADQLDVIYAPNLPQTVIENHEYAMSSHGLFIAGIIRSIAPQAKLRLIQVLNDTGGGSLESVAYGFGQALLADPSVPIVFNCSFMLHVPRPGDPPLPPDVEQLDPQVILELTQGLSDIFAHANQWLHVAIVAAAGNDGSAVHPKARFPAAFEHVAGVAALAAPSGSAASPALAPYSDQADDQTPEGFAAIGGDIDPALNPPTADANHGVLGVFIEPFPLPLLPEDTIVLAQNSSGWARWAGTSFATPLVSASVANTISSGTPPKDASAQLQLAGSATPIGRTLEFTQGS